MTTMNIEDIPTPETDKVAEDNRGCSNNECVHADFARTLERQKAALREALEVIIKAEDKFMADSGIRWEDGITAAIGVARATLAATKPTR